MTLGAYGAPLTMTFNNASASPLPYDEVSKAGSQLYDILWVVLSLALVFGSLFLVLWWLRRRQQRIKPDGAVAVIERVALSQSSYLAVVRAYDRLVLISVSKDSVSFLCDLGDKTIAEQVAAAANKWANASKPGSPSGNTAYWATY